MSQHVHTVIAAAGILLALAGAPAAGQQQAFRLDLESHPELAMGKVAGVEGTLQGAGHRFVVFDLSILQPVAVTLQTLESARPLRLRLHKTRWDEPEREATTGADGSCTVKVRTQGELRIEVQGAEGASYRLAVWAGEEAVPAMPPALISHREHAAKSPRPGLSRGALLAVVVTVAAFGLATASLVGTLVLLKRR